MSATDTQHSRYANTNANARLRSASGWGSDGSREQYTPSVGTRVGSVLVLSGPKRKTAAGSSVNRPSVPRPVSLPSQKKDRIIDSSSLLSKQRHDENSQYQSDHTQTLSRPALSSQTAIWQAHNQAHGRDAYGLSQVDRPINTHEFPSLSATVKHPQLKQQHKAPTQEDNGYWTDDDRGVVPLGPSDDRTHRESGGIKDSHSRNNFSEDDDERGFGSRRGGDRGDFFGREGGRPNERGGDSLYEDRRGGFNFGRDDRGSGAFGSRRDNFVDTRRSEYSRLRQDIGGRRYDSYGNRDDLRRDARSSDYDRYSPAHNDYQGPSHLLSNAVSSLITSPLLAPEPKPDTQDSAAAAEEDEVDEERAAFLSELDRIKQELEEKQKSKEESKSQDIVAEGAEGDLASWEDAHEADAPSSGPPAAPSRAPAALGFLVREPEAPAPQEEEAVPPSEEAAEAEAPAAEEEDQVPVGTGLKPVSLEAWKKRQEEEAAIERERKARAAAKLKAIEDAVRAREEAEAAAAAAAAAAVATEEQPVVEEPTVVEEPPAPEVHEEPPKAEAPEPLPKPTNQWNMAAVREPAWSQPLVKEAPAKAVDPAAEEITSEKMERVVLDTAAGVSEEAVKVPEPAPVSTGSWRAGEGGGRGRGSRNANREDGNHGRGGGRGQRRGGREPRAQADGAEEGGTRETGGRSKGRGGRGRGRDSAASAPRPTPADSRMQAQAAAAAAAAAALAKSIVTPALPVPDTKGESTKTHAAKTEDAAPTKGNSDRAASNKVSDATGASQLYGWGGAMNLNLHGELAQIQMETSTSPPLSPGVSPTPALKVEALSTEATAGTVGDAFLPASILPSDLALEDNPPIMPRSEAPNTSAPESHRQTSSPLTDPTFNIPYAANANPSHSRPNSSPSGLTGLSSGYAAQQPMQGFGHSTSTGGYLSQPQLGAGLPNNVWGSNPSATVIGAWDPAMSGAHKGPTARMFMGQTLPQGFVDPQQPQQQPQQQSQQPPMVPHQVAPGQQPYNPFAYAGGGIFPNYAPVPTFGHMAFTPTTKAPDWSNSAANTAGWGTMPVQDVNGQVVAPTPATSLNNNQSFSSTAVNPGSANPSAAVNSYSNVSNVISQPQGIPQRRQRSAVEMNLPDNLLGGTASPPVHLQPTLQGSPGRGPRSRGSRGSRGGRGGAAAAQQASATADENAGGAPQFAHEAAPRSQRGGRGGRRGNSHSHSHSNSHKPHAAKAAPASTAA